MKLIFNILAISGWAMFAGVLLAISVLLGAIGRASLRRIF